MLLLQYVYRTLILKCIIRVKVVRLSIIFLETDINTLKESQEKKRMIS